MKPLVFLDVDGVINDIGSLYGGHRDFAVYFVKSHGHTVHIPEYMPQLIQKLTENCEVHWLTTWRERANDEIVEALGIDPLPVVTDGSMERTTSWKTGAAFPIALKALKEGREVWWIEDFYKFIPTHEMPRGVKYVDTAAISNKPVLLPMMMPKHLIGDAEIPESRFGEPVPKHAGIFKGALQRMFGLL